MPKKPKPTLLTSKSGDLPANTGKVTIMDLLNRLSITGDIQQMDGMIDALNVDRDELYMILDQLAQNIPRDQYQKTQQSLRGILSWGVAIGYFYARQTKSITVVN